MFAYDAVILMTLLVATCAAYTTTRSLGTFVDCSSFRSSNLPCRWAGENGQIVDSHTLRELLLQRNYVADSDRERVLRNLEEHMTYIEDVNIYATSVGHEFTYLMGVNKRHLTVSSHRQLTPKEFVEQERTSISSRRLQTQTNNTNVTSSTGSTAYWNWCESDNRMGRTVCSPVKSQQNCGSCWSFVAADAIETAVVIAENSSAAVSLSPQQFLTCSTFRTTQTFEYCWVPENGVPGVSWMQPEIMWESQNDGCNGGMTHGAFMDAAQNRWGLVTELTMPYDDANSARLVATNTSSMCNVSASQAAASITGYEQIVGIDCSVSNNCALLLRQALERQPIAVAFTSNGGFAEYAGGFYNCPNNGDMAMRNDLNHALLLVGYGTDSLHGDYWILKNSYGSSWGESGFIRVIADNKINCGLNVFPIIPLGARAGAQANVVVDSGGDEIFVGLSPSSWIGVAAATTALTLILTAIGIWVSSQKLKVISKQNSTMYLAQTPTDASNAY